MWGWRPGLTCCLTSCYSGLSWYKWGMMVLAATCQQYNYTSPPPYWDNDRWCRYCVCRQMDKNMREPRWKVSRLGFDNFIMTSRACFVVITDCPELWLDLYCDRHLTPRTVIQSPPPPSTASTSQQVGNISCLIVWPSYFCPQSSQWPLPLNCQIPKIYWRPPAALYLRFNSWEKCWNYVLIQFGVMFQLWGPGQTDWPISWQ